MPGTVYEHICYWRIANRDTNTHLSSTTASAFAGGLGLSFTGVTEIRVAFIYYWFSSNLHDFITCFKGNKYTPEIRSLIYGFWFVDCAEIKRFIFILRRYLHIKWPRIWISQWLSQGNRHFLYLGHRLFHGWISGSRNPEYFNVDTCSGQPSQGFLCRKSLPGLDISSISALYSLLKIHSSHVLTCAVAQKTQAVQFVSQPRGKFKKTNKPNITYCRIVIGKFLRQSYVKNLEVGWARCSCFSLPQKKSILCFSVYVFIFVMYKTLPWTITEIRKVSTS